MEYLKFEFLRHRKHYVSITETCRLLSMKNLLRPWRITHFLDNRLTDGFEVVSLTRCVPFSPRKIPGTRVDPRAIVRLEGLGVN
jgi:hypothetical protein